MSVNVVTTESAAFVLDATVVVIPVYPRGGCVRWLCFSATMYVSVDRVIHYTVVTLCGRST